MEKKLINIIEGLDEIRYWEMISSHIWFLPTGCFFYANILCYIGQSLSIDLMIGRDYIHKFAFPFSFFEDN